MVTAVIVSQKKVTAGTTGARGQEMPVMSTWGLVPPLFLKEFGAIDYCLFPFETYRGCEFWNCLQIKGAKNILRFLIIVSPRNVAL
jgi:hypothetical protein